MRTISFGLSGSSTGVQAYVTGAPAIQNDLDPVFSKDLQKGESIALPIALVVLLLVFGLSWAVTIPLLFAASTAVRDACRSST